MLLSKLKEALICIKAGRVTLPYPYLPHEPQAGFRGMPAVDGGKCVGCGGCAAVCPPRLITIKEGDGQWQLTADYSRCTYCGRCADVCPEGATKMTQNFELATDSRADLVLTIIMHQVKCSKCGNYFITERMLNKVNKVLEEKWSEEELPVWTSWCPECRLGKHGKALGRMEGLMDE
ncbi:MAG TPA: 4Fe-4S dicluster domain-containing protein [Syntrophomonadaceae bacterium]|nr:4Fe-4S dicluster domain-containing protein [Syntrophomonadaceae bacterium]